MNKGESSIEVLADRIEARRAGRIPVPFQMRKLFLNNCRDIAKEEGYINKMSVLALHKLRDEYKSKVNAKESPLTPASHATKKVFGYWDEELMMLELLDQACIYVAEVNASWFFFRDFSYYNTVLSHRIRLFGSPLVAAIAYLSLFYLGSAVLFCSIMKDDAVCPDRDTYDGWLTAVYFASVTMVSHFSLVCVWYRPSRRQRLTIHYYDTL